MYKIKVLKHRLRCQELCISMALPSLLHKENKIEIPSPPIVVTLNYQTNKT